MKLTLEQTRYFLGKDWPCRQCQNKGAPDNCRHLCDRWIIWHTKHWRGIRKDAAKLKRKNR